MQEKGKNIKKEKRLDRTSLKNRSNASRSCFEDAVAVKLQTHNVVMPVEFATRLKMYHLSLHLMGQQIKLQDGVLQNERGWCDVLGGIWLQLMVPPEVLKSSVRPLM